MSMNNYQVRQELAILANERRNKPYDEPWKLGIQWLFKPQQGLTDFRLLNNPHNKDGNSFTPLLLHYAVTKDTLLSPQAFQRPDKVLEHCDALMDSNDRKKCKIAARLRPHFNYFAPILVRGQEGTGIQLLRLTEVQYGEFQKSVSENIDWQINDYQSGRDITMRKTSEGYCSFSLHEDISPVTDDPLILWQIQLPFPHPASFYREPSYDELNNLLVHYLDEITNKRSRIY